MKTPIRPVNWHMSQVSEDKLDGFPRTDACEPELAVRVSHPERFVEELFIAAWRPVPNPGGIPAAAETSPTDAELIADFKFADERAKAELAEADGRPNQLLPADHWGHEVMVSRPQIGIARHTVFTNDIEREFYIGVLRDQSVFLTVRADRNGRVSLPLQLEALLPLTSRQHAQYVMDVALEACRARIPEFAHSEMERVAGKPDMSLLPFVRPFATRRFGHAHVPDGTGVDHMTVANDGAREFEAASRTEPPPMGR